MKTKKYTVKQLKADLEMLDKSVIDEAGASCKYRFALNNINFGRENEIEFNSRDIFFTSIQEAVRWYSVFRLDYNI